MSRSRMLENENTTRWYRRQRAAEYLGLAEGTLANWATRGFGPQHYVAPNGIVYYDVVDLDGWPGVVMEYIPSRSLRDIVTDRGPLPPRYVAAIGLAVLDALTAAHRVGVLHRDVKPGNILVARTGRVVLTDFGIATRCAGPVDGDDHLVATPAYVAPERVLAGLSLPAGDLWSLGASLYLAVEGRPPYLRVSPQATVAAVATLPPDPGEHAGPLRPVLDGLLNHDPTTRLRPVRARSMLLAVARGANGPRPELCVPSTASRSRWPTAR